MGRACCGVKGKSLFPLVFGDPGNEPLDAAGQVPGVAPLLPVEKPLGAYERVGHLSGAPWHSGPRSSLCPAAGPQASSGGRRWTAFLHIFQSEFS